MSYFYREIPFSSGKRCISMKHATPASLPVSEEPARRTDPAVRELILRAQEGSDEACRELRTRYRPLLDASVARFSSSELTQQDLSDLAEEAELVFLGAITSYDCDQDAVDFGLYAKICLRNGLISEWRRIRARIRVQSVDEAESDLIPDPAPDPAGHMMEEESFRTLCRTIRAHLSDFENRVWWPYVTGVTVPDIARELGCEERSVHNALYRIRRKLREKINAGDEEK